jgi:hypothetical protein
MKKKTVFCICIEMGVRKMKAKIMISLLAGIAAAGFAVCPVLAASGEVSGTYVAPPKEHNLITGTLDYLGSVVDVTKKGTWETYDRITPIPSKRCGERITYRPSLSMNRGSRWVRRYKR